MACASVEIEGKTVSSITFGLVILLGVEHSDTKADAEWLVRKVVNLRIFDDAQGVMNNSVLDAKAEILIISQFTLHASTKKGNRPSYIRAAKPDIAIPLYEHFVDSMKNEDVVHVGSGKFGANMKVTLTNDGPVTIIIDTKNKK